MNVKERVRREKGGKRERRGDALDLVPSEGGDLGALEVEVELKLLVLVVAEQLLAALVVVRIEALEVQLLLLVKRDRCALTSLRVRLRTQEFCERVGVYF